MKKIIFAGLLTFAFLVNSAQLQYNNPILPGFHPDPSICAVNDDYYLVNSTFAYFPGLPVYHSKDLVNWRAIGHALNRNSQLPLQGAGVSRGLFAPDITYHDGTFYITCTLVDKGGNFVITAKYPAGPWSDPVWLPEVDGIDPSLFFDDDGKTYLVYNSIPPNNKLLYDGHRTIRMRGFDLRTLKVTAEEKIIVNGGTDISKNPVWIEGPHIYKKDDWYYLLCAEGGTYENHSVVIFRSKSAEGPYISFEGNPILTQRHLDKNRKHPITCVGHADLVQAGNGSWHAVFLGCRPYKDDHYNTGRETFMVPVVWENGWPVMNKGHEEIQYHYDVPMPEITKKVNDPVNATDDFSNGLGEQWMFLRNPVEQWYKIDKGLSIKLRPQTCAGKANPSFIAQRQRSLNASVSTGLSFSPASSNEKAGIAAFQDEHHFYYLCRSVGVVQLYRSEELLKSVFLNSNADVELRIDVRGATYDFFYNNILLASTDATFLSTATTGGFVGVVFALYATSSGKESNSWAHYKFFAYRNQ